MPEKTEFTEQPKKFRKSWLYALLILLAVVLVFVFFRYEDVGKILSKLAAVFTPIFYGIATAYILNPVMVFFERLYVYVAEKVFKVKRGNYKKHANTAAIILSILFLVAVIWLLIYAILPQLYHTIIALIGYVPDGLDRIKEIYDDLVNHENSFLNSLGISFDTILENIENWFTNNLATAVNSALQYITSGVVFAVSFIVNLIIGICVAVYLMREKKHIFAHIKKIIYATFKKQMADSVVQLGVHAKNIFNGYIYGTIIGCIIVFVATFLFMLIMKMPYAILISTIVCITNFIPFFGPFIGAVPSILILLLHDPIMALTFTIFTLALQQVEGHFLTPLIISDTTGVSPFWVTVALLIGGGLFGFFGLIMSVPIFSVLYYIIKTLVERKLETKQLPTSTEAYVVDNDFKSGAPEKGKLASIFKAKKKKNSKADKEQ